MIATAAAAAMKSQLSPSTSLKASSPQRTSSAGASSSNGIGSEYPSLPEEAQLLNGGAMARQQPLPQSQKPKQLQLPDPPPLPPPQQQPLANEMAMLATEMAGLASEMATVKVENAQLLRILNKVKSQLVAVQSEVDELRGGASAGAGTSS